MTMHELAPHQVIVSGSFWGPRLKMNARDALPHQWEQLIASGCIENFRIAAGQSDAFREGWFFADSDAYKWLDAAARALVQHPLPTLARRVNDLITLLAAAQQPDGYLYTYNQIHFPGTRWENLQIEHELYCHGHLIEAGVSHHQATGRRDLLALAEKAADRIVADFAGAGPPATPGHEEIELALLRLYRAAGRGVYLDLAEQFVEQRGCVRPFAPLILRQNSAVGRRSKEVARRRAEYRAHHPGESPFHLPPGNVAAKPRGMGARYYLSALTGNYFQQHRPLREQRVPVGHAVRFAYLETAAAMLCRERGSGPSADLLRAALEAAWSHMVARRMYVTGGIGSLPGIEGFGRDYELDPEYAYAETCAALGAIFWNWEMLLLTGEARYADLFEWQLYNAASVGMGLDGRSYLYNNPLASRGGVTRRPWYAVPCCPSNLSRTWAWLGQYIYSVDDGALWVHQYIGNRAAVDVGVQVGVEMESWLPWDGQVRLRLFPQKPARLALYLRMPGWAEGYRVAVNGERVEVPAAPDGAGGERPASGYSPERAFYLPVERTWSAGDVVEIDLSMPVVARRAHPRVSSVRGRVALTRGPLVYCLESPDNPGVDLFQDPILPGTAHAEPAPELFDGVHVLRGQMATGRAFTAIPYSYWANRGESQMAVWVRGDR
ncbi:MAG: glycoside hydrolase family 127 protein [Anaerolineae bacterium]|nr:glycoside hydrolase family 127 protein [Anaerolineae bacterium]